MHVERDQKHEPRSSLRERGRNAGKTLETTRRRNEEPEKANTTRAAVDIHEARQPVDKTEGAEG